jgi:tRNA nucleotidyltransferase (CCA-adding enzyme)
METKLSRILKTIFTKKESSQVIQALEAIQYVGGKAFLVGGAVRDLLLNKSIKDIDIEVHKVALEDLQKILKKFGHVNLVGKSFGVLKWEHSQIDWAIPRKDYAGRKPIVTLNPEMDIVEALKRRDLTINAMALDLSTGEVVDPFNGQADLKNYVARSPDVKFFTQDPLRFYRVMQFIGRFDLVPDKALNSVCSTMDITKISTERIFSEFDKLFLKSRMPSKGIRWINKINRLGEVLPDLDKTVGLLQERKWHPERDVFEHTMQTLDAAANFVYQNEEEKLTVLSAALCHDLGKIVATFIKDKKIKNTGHAAAGLPFVKNLMRRITNNKKRIISVCKLVEYHMEPGSFVKNNAADKTYRKFALKLYPAINMRLLSMISRADVLGRNPFKEAPLNENEDVRNPYTGKSITEKLNDIDKFINRAKKLGVFEAPLPPILTGKDLVNKFKSGPILGKALKKAYEIQICENIIDKKILKRRVIYEFLQSKI